MTDRITTEQRSYTMSRIRGKWTRQEKIVHNILKAIGVKHKMHPKIKGNPDIIISGSRIAIFLHGCFWHKCPLHYRPPKSNKNYWLQKIEMNVTRDKKNARLLRKAGWKIVIIWEHSISNIHSGKKLSATRIKRLKSVP